jgi:type I restriction enzyme S subunit
MGSEWRSTTLGQVVEEGGGFIQTGPFGSQLHASDYVAKGIPTIMPANMANNRVDITGIARITEEDAERLSKHIVQPDDIVYSRRGDVTLKALIRESDEKMICGTGCLLVRPGKGIDPKFLTYHLSSPQNQEWIIRHAIGATMPNLNQGILSNVPLHVPSISIQKAIAHILGTLDDKIELNRQMNATLEAMAQALFQSWFVDFDPVIDNALAAGHPIPDALQERAAARAALGHRRQPLPAAIQSQFPSRFVRHEEMGWVPAGWAVARIGDVLELAYGKSLPATRRLEGSVPVYGSGGISGFHTEHFVNGPGIVVGRKGTVGSLYWVEDNFFPIDTVFFVINKSHTPLYWLYQTLKRIDIKSMGADSAVPGVNRNAVYAKPIIIPNVTAFKGYLAQIEPNNLKRRELEDQIKTLATLRDTLLPKLLSGAVRVAAAG